MIRGYLVNEFGEKVGDYNIRSVGKYHVSLFHQNKGIMDTMQLLEYADRLGLYPEESDVVLNKVGKEYGEE